jgi:hypothetical protein
MRQKGLIARDDRAHNQMGYSFGLQQESIGYFSKPMSVDARATAARSKVLTDRRNEWAEPVEISRAGIEFLCR